jgi:hypothetical protein
MKMTVAQRAHVDWLTSGPVLQTWHGARARLALAVPTPPGLPNPPACLVFTYWPRVGGAQWCGDFTPTPEIVN